MLHKLKLKNVIQTNSYNESINKVTAVPNQLHRKPLNISKTSNDENVAIQKLRSIADGKNISLGIFSIAERTLFDEMPIDLKSIIRLAF